MSTYKLNQVQCIITTECPVMTKSTSKKIIMYVLGPNSINGGLTTLKYSFLELIKLLAALRIRSLRQIQYPSSFNAISASNHDIPVKFCTRLSKVHTGLI